MISQKMSLESVPDELLYDRMIPFLGGHHLVSLGLTQKRFIRIVKSELERMKHNARLINQWFDSSIVSLFGNCAMLAFWPQLEWKDAFLGSTGYIDRIGASDVHAPIHWGRSTCGRAFITLRTNRGVVVFFQRYSMEPNTWSVGDGDSTYIFRSPGYFLTRGRLTCSLFGVNLYNLIIGFPKHFSRNWANDLYTSRVVLV